MKKVLLSLLVAIAATLAFISCSGSKGAETPREAVEKLSEAFKSGNMEAALAVMCKNGNMLTDEDLQKAKDEEDSFNKRIAGTEIQIVEEEVREEGKKVRFRTILKKDGKEDREGMTAYNIDGKWYVDM